MSLRVKLVHAAVGVALAVGSLLAVAEPAQATNTCVESPTINGWQMGVCLTKAGNSVRGDVYVNQLGSRLCAIYVELWDDNNNRYDQTWNWCSAMEDPINSRPFTSGQVHLDDCRQLHSHAWIKWYDTNGNPTGQVSRYGDSKKLPAC